MSREQIVSIIVVVALVGFGVGYYVGGGNVSSQGSYQEGWNAAKQRLKETGYAFIPDKVTRVEGNIKKVNGDSSEMVVKIEPLSPLADPKLDTRVLKLTGDTEIIQKAEKDQEKYEKQIKEYERSMQKFNSNASARNASDEEPPEPPKPFVEKGAKLSDLEAGQRVSATAMNSQNIKKEKSFKVSKVVVESMATTTSRE